MRLTCQAGVVGLAVLLAACSSSPTKFSGRANPNPDSGENGLVAGRPVLAVPADMLNPAVTQGSIATTICTKGWTATIRPPVGYTEPVKRLQIRSYRYRDKRLGQYEEDHVIALEVGGAPVAKVNLFPEPHRVSGKDDGLENSLHSRVCSGKLTLEAAQRQLLAAKVAHGYDRVKSAV